jgi:hypothetical protein
MTASSSDAAIAGQTNASLFHQYANTGVPALSAGIEQATAGLQQGLPGYAKAAYEGARGSAAEGSRAKLLQNLGQVGGLGGGGLNNLTTIAASGGQAYAREMAGINASQAVADISQRNSMMRALAGGAADSTNLGAGFGSMTNQGLGIAAQSSPWPGLAFGGISAGLGIYGQSQINKQSALNPSLYGGSGFDSSGRFMYAPGGNT